MRGCLRIREIVGSSHTSDNVDKYFRPHWQCAGACVDGAVRQESASEILVEKGCRQPKKLGRE